MEQSAVVQCCEQWVHAVLLLSSVPASCVDVIGGGMGLKTADETIGSARQKYMCCCRWGSGAVGFPAPLVTLAVMDGAPSTAPAGCCRLLPGGALQLLCTGVLHGFGCTALSAHAVRPVVPQYKSSWGLLLNSPRVGWAVQVGFPELMGSALLWDFSRMWVPGSIASPEHPPGASDPIAHPCVSRGRVGEGLAAGCCLSSLLLLRVCSSPH